jgi:uncharacterized protein
MAVDHIRYDILAQEALRGVVRQVLADTAKKGLPGEHHFFITFDTRAPAVRLSARMREQYPEEMTIVLQHQFWDLKVSEGHFEVGLSFGGVPENLLVPFDAIKSFFDPSIQFGLQFETIAEGAQADAAAAKPELKDQKGTRLPARHDPLPASLPQTAPATEPDPGIPAADDASNQADKPAAQVVHLDRFRTK